MSFDCKYLEKINRELFEIELQKNFSSNKVLSVDIFLAQLYQNNDGNLKTCDMKITKIIDIEGVGQIGNLTLRHDGSAQYKNNILECALDDYVNPNCVSLLKKIQFDTTNVAVIEEFITYRKKYMIKMYIDKYSDCLN